MSRRRGREVDCDAATRAARHRKAQEFLESAEDLGEDRRAAFVSLCVLAGIAAADVVCCARLGAHAAGDDHAHAVAMLGRVDTSAAAALRRLLAVKPKAEYSGSDPSAAEVTQAYRAAAALVEAATAALA